MRKPGHREGVRRHQRYGQQTLPVGKTLSASLAKLVCVNDTCLYVGEEVPSDYGHCAFCRTRLAEAK